MALRPAVDTEPTTTNAAEAFQNQTLRPILKLHNELFLSLFRSYLVRRKQAPDGRFSRITPPEQEAYIEHTLRTDQKFRNLLIGTVIGQFTSTELADFLADEAELTRRTLNMISQRLIDQNV
ncbi:glyoxalase [Fibrella sp. HMF5036]|uniref:Glyoxalase n=1 Tax=Fibrella aquatilis TaxID=2817059 RepID=A0A939K3F4_9BACT|nr:glyoxalase [Fibrella aquatilis]